MNSPKQSTAAAPTVRSTLSVNEHQNIQFVEFENGVTGLIQTVRALVDIPAVVDSVEPPPQAGEALTGDYRGVDVAPFNAGEQVWFKTTFCNGAQQCVQGWDWAVAVSDRKVGSGSGISMVGSEGTLNARFSMDQWVCACTTPFCIGGPTCVWINFWSAVVLPGHWLSIGVNGNSHYIQWRLEGAGGNTQVSLATNY